MGADAVIAPLTVHVIEVDARIGVVTVWFGYRLSPKKVIACEVTVVEPEAIEKRRAGRTTPAEDEHVDWVCRQMAEGMRGVLEALGHKPTIEV